MDARLNYFTSPAAGKVFKHLMAVGKEFENSSLPSSTRELVALRVSQISGGGDPGRGRGRWGR